MLNGYYRRPRDSYGFVSRVATSPKLDKVALASKVDLFPGNGRKTESSCSPWIKISDVLRREDIEILKQKDAPVLQLKPGIDVIICQHWIGASRPAPAPGGQVARFSDGTVIYDHQIDQLVR